MTSTSSAIFGDSWMGWALLGLAQAAASDEVVVVAARSAPCRGLSSIGTGSVVMVMVSVGGPLDAWLAERLKGSSVATAAEDMSRAGRAFCADIVDADMNGSTNKYVTGKRQRFVVRISQSRRSLEK